MYFRVSEIYTMKTQTAAELIAKLEAPSWFSGTKYMKRDIEFILKLLTAPVYKSIPNLYEQLVAYKATIERLSERLLSFQNEVIKFKDSLENYPEKDDPSIDEYYYVKLKHFKDDFVALDSKFLEI
mgnify:CR=1 FL=1